MISQSPIIARQIPITPILSQIPNSTEKNTRRLYYRIRRLNFRVNLFSVFQPFHCLSFHQNIQDVCQQKATQNKHTAKVEETSHTTGTAIAFYKLYVFPFCDAAMLNNLQNAPAYQEPSFSAFPRWKARSQKSRSSPECALHCWSRESQCFLPANASAE